MAILRPGNRLVTRAQTALLVSVVVTVLLYIVPFGHTIGYPLVLLSTYVHEMGHGVAGMLTGAHFDAFHLYANGSGVTMVHGNSGRLASAFIAAGGLVGPAVVAAAFFFLARRENSARWALGTFGAGSLLACVVVVRNLFGWVFIAPLGAICLLLARRAPPRTSQITLAFLATQLALSVFSRGDYLFTSQANTGAGRMPSDVANMATALFLPFWFWGAVCGLFSVVVVAWGLLGLWRGATR